MKFSESKWVVVLAAGMVFTMSATASLRGDAIESALKAAAKVSGRELVETGGRKAMGESLERLAVIYGDEALVAVQDGGLELLEAVAKHGDEVMGIAVKSSVPARRMLAVNAGELMPLVKRFGQEALELEAKAPGLSTTVFTSFGDDGGKWISQNAPNEDLPRLCFYAEKADSPATRNALFNSYRKEGTSLFERIPPSLVMASGLSVAMIVGTENITDPIGENMGETIRQNPEIVEKTLQTAVWGGVLVVFAIAVLILWRLGMMPWQRPKEPVEEVVAVDEDLPDEGEEKEEDRQ